jgi:hypothetical protein
MPISQAVFSPRALSLRSTLVIAHESTMAMIAMTMIENWLAASDMIQLPWTDNNKAPASFRVFTILMKKFAMP